MINEATSLHDGTDHLSVFPMAIQLTGHIVIPLDELKMIEAEMPAHIINTRQEAGCITFDLEKIADHPGHYSVFEIFKDREAFEHHQQRVKQSKWGQLTQNIERNYSIQEL